MKRNSALLPFEVMVAFLEESGLPLLGLGTYMMRSGRDTEDAVLWALDAGYQLIDTATLYENEHSVGMAWKKSGVPREEIFITTKLRNSDHGYKRALAAFCESLGRLGLERSRPEGPGLTIDDYSL